MTKRLATMYLVMMLLFDITLFASVAWTQRPPSKYLWQEGDTPCDKTMSFCWYDSDIASDPTVTANGNRWVSQDKEERPLEWITMVQCAQKLHVCILARNQKIGNGSRTNIDLYQIEEWSNYQIRTVGVGDSVRRGNECEIVSLLLNRAEGSVSMLSVPGPAAATKGCLGVMKPKTVVFKLEIGLPTF